MTEERKVLTSKDFWIQRFEKYKKLLEVVKKVFDKECITFFLFYGTLLGAIRENDFILGDDDVDVAILAEDAHKLNNLKAAFEQEGYLYDVGGVLKEVFMNCYVSKEDAKIDIYTLFLYKDTRWFLRWIDSNHGYHALPYDQKHFKTLDTIDFKGDKYNVPHNSEELLEEMWGKNPPEAWWIATGRGQFGLKNKPKIFFTEKEFKPEGF